MEGLLTLNPWLELTLVLEVLAVIPTMFLVNQKGAAMPVAQRGNLPIALLLDVFAT